MAQWMSWWILNPCVPGSNLGNRMIFFVDFFLFIYFFNVFLSLLLQYKFANSTLLSLLSFSYFITPYDAQASSAFIFITSGPELCLHINCLQSCLGKERSLRARILFQYLPKS